MVGGRSIVKIMETFNEVYDGTLGKIPCANTIDLWTCKCGLDTYNRNAAELRDQEYCEILDESMMIGSNKLVLTLAAPAKHLQHPLTHSDVAVIGIDTAESFNAEKICDTAVKSAAKVGHAPEYVITDNARAMIKGVSDAGYRRHADITHTLGVHLERTYKEEEDFREYCKLMSDAQFQHNMKRVAYLMPPRQRTVSRFINLDNWVKWSLKVLDVYHRLESAEREVLSFVPAHASLVEELSEVMRVVRFIESLCKKEGLSKASVNKCIRHLSATLLQGNERMRRLGLAILEFLREEVSWMGDDEIHNNSSDIIESSYGVYKNRKSPNKLYGVTSMVLMMPVFEKLSNQESARKYNFREHLENIKVHNINLWKKKNLPENLVSKRIRTLSLAVGF